MAIDGRRILVIGAGGFLGRHVVQALVNEGALVSAIDVFKPASPDPRITWHIGSAQDEPFVSSVTAGCEIVIYLAGHSLPATANADMASEITGHVRTTIKTAEIADLMGVRSFIFASSGGTVYGRSSADPLGEDEPTFPRNAYGASKLACENYLRVLGELRSIRTLSLRISNPYGEGQSSSRGQGFVAAVIDRLVAGQTLDLWGDGSVVRDFIYAGDVARAFVKACDYQGPAETVNIGSGKGYSLIEVVRKVEEQLRLSLNIAFKEGRAIDVGRNVLRIEKASRILDWSPETSLELGLRKTCAPFFRPESSRLSAVS